MPLTYDLTPQLKVPSLEDVMQADTPDHIEIGETNIYWLFAVRSEGRIEFVSKQSGEVVSVCSLETASQFGLSEGQIKAAEQAFRL